MRLPCPIAGSLGAYNADSRKPQAMITASPFNAGDVSWNDSDIAVPWGVNRQGLVHTANAVLPRRLSPSCAQEFVPSADPVETVLSPCVAVADVVLHVSFDGVDENLGDKTENVIWSVSNSTCRAAGEGQSVTCADGLSPLRLPYRRRQRAQGNQGTDQVARRIFHICIREGMRAYSV